MFAKTVRGRIWTLIVLCLLLASLLPPAAPVHAEFPEEDTGVRDAQVPTLPFESFPTTSSDAGYNLNAGDPISAATGEYYFFMNLFNLGGVLPLTFRLYYSSVGATKRRGDGLPFPSDSSGSATFFTNQRLTITEIKFFEPPAAFVEKGLGEEIGFHQTAGGWVAYDLEAIRYQLKETKDYYYLLDPIQELVYTFQKEFENEDMAIGILIAVQDRNGNTLTYEYPSDGGLTGYDIFWRGPDRITDGLGRELRFTYELMGTDLPFPFLTRVEDQNGRAWTLQYEVPAADNPSVPTGVTLRSITDPMGNVTTFRYGDHHRITAIERPKGNVPLTQTYNPAYSDRGVVETQRDAYGNTTWISADQFESRTEEVEFNGREVAVRVVSEESQFTVTYPDGTQQVFQHDHGSRVMKSLTDQAGKKITFQSDPVHHRVTGVTDRLGDTTRITYHPETGKLASYTDAEGNTTNFTYTPQVQSFSPITFTFYNLTRVDYPDGTHEEFAYDDHGNVTTYTDRLGNQWTFTYNDRGQVLTVTNPEGGVVTYTYNPDGTLASSTDSDTGTTTYTYDALKRLTQVNYPDGTNIQVAYNDNDQITQITDRRGVVYKYEYDANGNLTRIERASGTAIAQTLRYEYDLMDRLSKFIDQAGKETQYNHDWRGLTQMVFPDGASLTLQYDPRGWINGLVDEAGKLWQAGYDDEGVFSSFTTPTGREIGLTTDKLGYITGLTDPLGNSYQFERDPLERVTKITDRLGREITIGRDGEGRITSITMPVVGTVTYQRDGLGNITRLTDQRGSHWDFEYTPMGRLKKMTDPLGHSWTYAYDSVGRLSQITYPDGVTETRTYDGNGNLIRREFSDGLTLVFNYDELNRLTSTSSVPVEITYDNRNLVTNTRIHGGDFGATYDDRRRLKTVTYDGRMTVTYTYDARGLVTKVEDDLTGSWVAFTYDDDRLLTQITRSNGQTTTFTRDANGRITKITHIGKGEIEYTLNAENEITRIIENLPLDVASFLASEFKQYTYDAANQITAAGFAYDERGRRTQDPDRIYTWDSADRLARITHQGNEITYDYTALGELAQKTANGQATKYFYNYALWNHPIVAEKTGGDYTRFYVYTPAGRLLYYVDVPASKPYFYHFNHLGSTLFLTDSAGQVTDSYGYTPYGRLVRHEGPSGQPFTFVGQEGVLQEGETGLYYMKARHYDSLTGRFISREPLWEERIEANPRYANPYQYAFQNPLRFIDPTGLEPQTFSAAPSYGVNDDITFMTNYLAFGAFEVKQRSFELPIEWSPYIPIEWIEEYPYILRSLEEYQEYERRRLKSLRESAEKLSSELSWEEKLEKTLEEIAIEIYEYEYEVELREKWSSCGDVLLPVQSHSPMVICSLLIFLLLSRFIRRKKKISGSKPRISEGSLRRGQRW